MNFPALRAAFDDLLNAGIFRDSDDQNGVFLPSNRPVYSLGLALEPFSGFDAWLTTAGLDAVFLHRPWRLTESQRAFLGREQIGVLAYHLAFDERLTTGFNPALAEALAWGTPTPLGEKEGRPLGMTCMLSPAQTFDELTAALTQKFGGPLSVHRPRQTLNTSNDHSIKRVAVVGAMTDALVRAAQADGADAYITGQFRQPARRGVEETGLGVIELGHHRSEVWGLCTLASLLRMHNPSLQIVLPEVF